MARNKSTLFRQKQMRLADFGKVISHPARVAILELLSLNGEMLCGEITENLPLAQSTVSQHLRELKETGIIRLEEDGVRSVYSLNAVAVEEFRLCIEGLLNELSNPLY